MRAIHAWVLAATMLLTNGCEPPSGPGYPDQKDYAARTNAAMAAGNPKEAQRLRQEYFDRYLAQGAFEINHMPSTHSQTASQSVPTVTTQASDNNFDALRMAGDQANRRGDYQEAVRLWSRVAAQSQSITTAFLNRPSYLNASKMFAEDHMLDLELVQQNLASYYETVEHNDKLSSDYYRQYKETDRLRHHLVGMDASGQCYTDGFPMPCVIRH